MNRAQVFLLLGDHVMISAAVCTLPEHQYIAGVCLPVYLFVRPSVSQLSISLHKTVMGLSGYTSVVVCIGVQTWCLTLY